MKRLHPYRLPFFLLMLLGCLLLSQGATAQIGDPDKVLKTEKQKKKPKKKKRKDPDQSPRDRVSGMRERQRKVDHKPGDMGADAPLPNRDDYYQEELNDKRGLKKRVKKGSVKEPGTHYTDRSKKDGKRAKSANGTESQGRVTIKEKDINQPGVVYDQKEREKASRRKNLNTISEGNLRVKRKDVDEPGQVYSQEDREKALKRKKLPGTTSQGNIAVKKSEITEPGTHYSKRDEKEARRYSSYNATKSAGRVTVKTKYIRQPGEHWSERKASFAKQYNSTEAAKHPGDINGMNRREKMRYYGELSAKMNMYEGNLKISKRERDMHPSVVARKATTMHSYEQKEKARKRSLLINRIFKNKEQPESVKAKDRKPRYDKGESEIWFE